MRKNWCALQSFGTHQLLRRREYGEFPGRAQYGFRPLEILGADLIEKDESTHPVQGNYKNGDLQRLILVVGDRLTRKCWATTRPGKSTRMS